MGGSITTPSVGVTPMSGVWYIGKNYFRKGESGWLRSRLNAAGK